MTYLIQVTGDKAIPGFALTGAAIIGVIGTLLARKYLNASEPAAEAVPGVNAIRA